MAIRCLALLSGGFFLFNTVAGCFARAADANHWWFDLRPVPKDVGSLLISAGAAAVVTCHCS